MSNKKTIESKNVKKFYVPKTAIFYFSDSDLSIFDGYSRNIVEYTKFIQIGSNNEVFDLNRKGNPYSKEFYSWIETKKGESRVMKPSLFFSLEGADIVKNLKELDLAIIVYKSNDIETLEYVDELSSYLCRNDVFSFHFVVENFVQSHETKKRYDKLVKNLVKRKEVYIPIKESDIVLAYKNANIDTRNYYANLYVNNLINLFLSPFLDPKKNPDAFSKTKALFFQNKKNFESKVMTTMGYSDEKIDNVDLALIQALSNPMFAAAFDASNSFIVDVKVPFYLEETVERIRTILENVVGKWKQFYINTSVGSFDYDVYCQISIMAINVDSSKLITDSQQIKEYINKILINIQNSKKLFDNKTKTIILNKNVNLMEN